MPPTISGLEIDGCPGASAGFEGGSTPWIAWSFLVFSALPTGEVGAGRFRAGVATGSTFGAELVGQHDKPIMHLYDPKFMMSKNYTYIGSGYQVYHILYHVDSKIIYL